MAQTKVRTGFILAGMLTVAFAVKVYAVDTYMGLTNVVASTPVQTASSSAKTTIGQNIVTNGSITGGTINGNIINGTTVNVTTLRFKDGTAQTTASTGARASASTSATGPVTASNGLTIGSPNVGPDYNATIKSYLSKTVSLTTSPIEYGACPLTEVSFDGAVPGDTVITNPLPMAGGIDALPYFSWNSLVPSNGKVAIRICNISSTSPITLPAQSWRIDIWKH